MNASRGLAQGESPYRYQSEGIVRLSRGAEVVLEYHYGGGARYPYCHPLNLPGGPSVTLHRPFDHPWHLGMYFAWKYINGLNVWEGSDSGERRGRTRDLSVTTFEDPTEGIGLCHALDWTDEAGHALLRDERALTIRPRITERYHVIDWLLQFSPLVDGVRLDRKVEWGGYAGLGIRLPRSFVRPSVRNAEGECASGEEIRAPRSVWTDYSGWVDGTKQREWAGVTIIDHSANPRYPTPWLVYDSAELKYLNAALLRDEPLELARGEVLRLAYRVLVHWGQADSDLTREEMEDFSRTDPAWGALPGAAKLCEEQSERNGG